MKKIVVCVFVLLISACGIFEKKMPIVDFIMPKKETQKPMTTPLMQAVRYMPNPELVDIFLKKGNSINQQDDQGFTALMYAVVYNENQDVALKLIDYGANTNLKTNKGNTALTLAQNNPNLKNTELLKLLEDLSTPQEEAIKVPGTEFVIWGQE